MSFLFSFLCLVLLSFSLYPTSSATATTVDLGVAASFAVLAKTSVSNTGTTSISGFIGAGTTISGLTGFSNTHQNDDTWAAGMNDAHTANGALNNQACDHHSTATTAVELGGLTLTPGVWCYDGPVTLTGPGTLTLDGQNDPNAVFIIRVSVTVTIELGAVIVPKNGAKPCNIFWVSKGGAHLSKLTTVVGVFIATTVTVNVVESVDGILIAVNESITIDTTVIDSTWAGSCHARTSSTGVKRYRSSTGGRQYPTGGRDPRGKGDWEDRDREDRDREDRDEEDRHREDRDEEDRHREDRDEEDKHREDRDEEDRHRDDRDEEDRHREDRDKEDRDDEDRDKEDRDREYRERKYREREYRRKGDREKGEEREYRRYSEPHIVGFWNQVVEVGGDDGEVYNLLSDEWVQINSRFVVLDGKSIHCPSASVGSTPCYPYTGVFGEIGVISRDGDRLVIEAGPIEQGFGLVTLNDKIIHSGESHGEKNLKHYESDEDKHGIFKRKSGQSNLFYRPDCFVHRPTSHSLTIRVGLYLISIHNIDGYLDIETTEITCWSCLLEEAKPEGLLGRTWDEKLKLPRFESFEVIEEFRERRGDLHGCHHKHDKFCSRRKY